MRSGETFKMHSIRWRSLPAGFAGSIFLAVSLGVLLDGRTHNLLQTVGLLFAALACAFVTLLGWYWVITPIPVLRIDAAGMTYQDFPFVFSRIHWAEVQRVRATKSREINHGQYGRSARLEVDIDLVPQADAGHGDRRSLWWRIGSADLSVAPEVIVRQIERYHEVVYDDQYDQTQQGGLIGSRRAQR
jgi:hypothetical protein